MKGLMWATAGVLAAVLLMAAGHPLAPRQPPTMYTQQQTPLLSKVGGNAQARMLAFVSAAIPLSVMGSQGTWSQVKLSGWMRQGSKTLVYADVGTVGGAIRAAQLSAPAPKPLATKTNAQTGVTWLQVVLVGWVPKSSLASSRTAMWKQANTLYTKTCSVCHALHAPSEFTSVQWPGYVKAMAPRTALSKAQVDQVLSYLQWHARDIPSSRQ